MACLTCCMRRAESSCGVHLWCCQKQLDGRGTDGVGVMNCVEQPGGRAFCYQHAICWYRADRKCAASGTSLREELVLATHLALSCHLR